MLTFVTNLNIILKFYNTNVVYAYIGYSINDRVNKENKVNKVKV